LDERAVQELFRLLNAYYKEERYKNEVIKNWVILPPK
jgi:hypothetical protein